jgi:hypothetical protein
MRKKGKRPPTYATASSEKLSPRSTPQFQMERVNPMLNAPMKDKNRTTSNAMMSPRER